MTRKQTIGLITYFGTPLILLALAVGEGWVSYRPAGICFGSCDSTRRKEFVDNFYAWSYVSAQCPDLSEQRRVLSELSMVLAHMLAPKSAPGAANQYEQIEYYASQELAGKLTVGEMDDYLSKPGFAVANGQIVVRENTQSFPEGFTPPNGRLIRPCAKEGFLIHHGSIDGYCEGFSYYSFSVSPQQYGGASDWEDVVGNAYDNRDEIHFRPTGPYRGIEERIKGAGDGVSRHLAAYGLAEDQMREMPASTIDSLGEAERNALVVTKGCEILENDRVGE